MSARTFAGSKPNQRDNRLGLADAAVGWTCQRCLDPIGRGESVEMHSPPGSNVTAVRHTVCPTQPKEAA